MEQSDVGLHCLTQFVSKLVFERGTCIKRLFWPPMRPKNEISFSQNSSYWFIRTMTQVYKSEISLTFTVAMVTKMASKTG